MAKNRKNHNNQLTVSQTNEQNKLDAISFYIPVDDPFVDGVIRFYVRNAGVMAIIEAQGLKLSSDDEFSVMALANYIVRCGGCVSAEQVKELKQILEKFKETKIERLIK